MKKMINTFAQIQVDLSKLKNPIVVIYDNPSDYKGYFVARVWDMDKPTDIFMLKKDLSKIREDIKLNLPSKIRLPRAKNDDPCIVETWI